MKKSKLVYITDKFPFGLGEAMFIKPELEIMKKYFDIIIISKNSNDDRTSETDASIPVFRFSQDFTLCEFIKNIIKSLSLPFFYNEVKLSCQKGNNILKSIRFVLPTTMRVIKFYDYLKQIDFGDKDDNIIFYSYWFTYATIGLVLLKKTFPNSSVVTRIHRYELYDDCSVLGYQQFHDFALKHISKVIFTCDTALQYFADKHPCTNKECFIVSALGAYDGLFIPYKEDSVFTLVSCSNLIPLKRVSLIMDAISLIKGHDIRWYHFVDGLLMDDLQQQALTQLSSMDNVKYFFMGHKSTEDIYEFYKSEKIDCFITLSESEGLPVSVMEAMAFSMPIIATNVGGISELIDGNGILLDEDVTAEQAAKAVCEVINASDTELNKMREKSFHMWSDRYNICSNSEKLAKLFCDNLL